MNFSFGEFVDRLRYAEGSADSYPHLASWSAFRLLVIGVMKIWPRKLFLLDELPKVKRPSLNLAHGFTPSTRVPTSGDRPSLRPLGDKMSARHKKIAVDD